MAEMSSNSGAEWSWARIVLTKSSRAPASPLFKLPTDLFTCPDRSIAGQVDMWVSNFRTSRTAGPNDLLDIANSRGSSMGSFFGDSEEDRTGITRHKAAISREWAERCARLRLVMFRRDAGISSSATLVNSSTAGGRKRPRRSGGRSVI